MSEKKEFNAKSFAIWLILFFVVVIVAIYILLIKIYNDKNNSKTNTNLSQENNNFEKESTFEVKEEKQTPVETTKVASKNEYALTDNNLSKFDLSFLKFENGKENKIYSPLSIKYAFKMLNEGASGETKRQLDEIVGEYELTKYKSNSNMAFANSFFVRDTYKNNVKQSYIDSIKDKYDAELIFDDFSSAKNINDWVKENTLGLIDNIYDDSDVSELQFALVNSLGIDMEWKHKFLVYQYEDDANITWGAEYNHAKLPNSKYSFGWNVNQELYGKKFDGNKKVSSMYVVASLNNYDAVKELGEENIRETVYNDFKEFALTDGKNDSEFFNNDYTEEGIKNAFDKWFDKQLNPDSTGSDDKYTKGYIEELNENYGRVDYSTDFSIYVNDDVKVFAKDLEESDNTTLQYIGIMPLKTELNNYIEKTTNEDIKDLIGNLKELKKENFKDGYLTYIHGYIPKFKFEYELDLKSDLNKLGVIDVFEQEKSDLSNITSDEGVFIDKVKHKANIEFTQDGIKAAAVTVGGGAGGGAWYDYFFEMPTEEIDITFDKPYMFLIRDKKTGETWFVGTVYEPLDVTEEKDTIFDAMEDRINEN